MSARARWPPPAARPCPPGAVHCGPGSTPVPPAPDSRRSRPLRIHAGPARSGFTPVPPAPDSVPFLLTINDLAEKPVLCVLSFPPGVTATPAARWSGGTCCRTGQQEQSGRQQPCLTARTPLLRLRLPLRCLPLPGPRLRCLPLPLRGLRPLPLPRRRFLPPLPSRPPIRRGREFLARRCGCGCSGRYPGRAAGSAGRPGGAYGWSERWP